MGVEVYGISRDVFHKARRFAWRRFGTVPFAMRRTSFALVFLLMAVSATQASPFRVGEPVPELTLPSLSDGSPLSLSDFRGKRVMLHVWASW